MTYYGFLAVFLVLPIGILLAYLWRQFNHQQVPLRARDALLVILLHVVLAVTWTTPWDNYLVATSVWWYDVTKVTGITIGYVPIEEYTFFVLQPILGGLWLIAFSRFATSYTQNDNTVNDSSFRVKVTLGIAVIWFISIALLVSPIDRTNYMGLELIWALPPIMLQVGFGADILRKNWKLVFSAIASLTIFLSLADAYAIELGIWTIDPAQSIGILLGGILPIEEALFFFLTNVLIVFGVTLALAPESQHRVRQILAYLKGNAPNNDKTFSSQET